jgi:hypothetical protein
MLAREGECIVASSAIASGPSPAFDSKNHRLPFSAAGAALRLAYAVIKSMTRIIATELLVFWVPSVVSALAHVQTSPFLTVNYFLF